MKKDLTGKKYNMLTVINEVDATYTSGGRRQRVWLCRCDCGKLTKVKQDRITTTINPIKSCGCIRNVKDVTGERFGRLVVVGFDEPTYTSTGHLIRMVKCICDCGNEKVLRYNDVVYGGTVSCGCYYREIHNLEVSNEYHGYSKTRLYSIWKGMNYRCNNSSCRAYKYYGAKGVKVCDEWRGGKGFLNFREWSIDNGYTDGLTIDRINPNGNYEPNNCRWITIKEQQRNRSSNHLLEFNGEKKTITEWSEITGLRRSEIYKRLKKGMRIEDVLNNSISKV